MSNIGELELPGHVALAGDIGGTFTGCCVAFIEGNGAHLATAMNDYFSTVAMGCLYVREVVVPGGLLVFYTRKFEPEEMAIYEEAQIHVESIMQDVLAKRAEAKQKEATEAAATEAEKERLVGVGRKCEENHAKDKAAMKGKR